MVHEQSDVSNWRQQPGRIPTGREPTRRETESLEQYRQKLARVALDEMYQFVAILDAEGTLLEVNRAALVGAGLQPSDVEGKPFWECYWWAVSKEIQETLQAAIGRAAQGEFIRYDVEIYGRASGRETIIIDFSIIPVRDTTGKVIYLVPEGRDITEKKAYEREIAQKNADLQALLERVRELDEIKTQFFANVSHELRTPLALILGPAERLMKEDGATYRLEAAQLIARNARMLLKHVEDLLAISTFEAGKLKIALQETDVAALVRLIASNFEVVAQERQIEYLVLADEEDVCAVDPEKFQRVLMNLLSNAFKFAPVGGTIRCTLQRVQSDLLLSIEDSGPGVKPELRQAIFERFRQGEGGTNRQFGGTGLGLAIAKEFVAMHQGHLHVLDSPLGGALFRVTLPTTRVHVLDVASSIPAPQPLSREIAAGLLEELTSPPALSDPHESVSSTTDTKIPILLVEDNPDMNTFLAQALSSDYLVTVAFDGQEGLHKALEVKPTLIITDLMMPKVSGVQMIAQIRQHPELLTTPIVILSAKADEALKVQLLQDGAQDFVTKPFSEHDLLVRVRNVIERKQVEERLRALAAIVESSDDAILSKDLAGIITSWNPAAERLYGYTAEAIVGQPVTRLYPPERQEEFQQIMARIRRGERVDHYETTRVCQNGSLVPVSVTVSPIKNRQGTIIGASSIARDITERTALEQQRKAFVNLVTHELRTPLTALKGSLQLARRGLSRLLCQTAPLAEAQHQTLEALLTMLGRSQEHLRVQQRLIDDMLDLAHIEEDQVELRLAACNLVDLVADTFQEYQAAHPSRLITLDLPEQNPILVWADRDRLQQVLGNYLTNALKFVPVSAPVRVGITLEAEAARVWVQDQGPGLSVEQQAQIWQRSYQVSRTPVQSGWKVGLGLGLYVCQHLIRRQQGEVGVQSRPGQGATFWFTLPLQSPLDAQ